MEKVFVCQVCGHLEFNDIPEKCPVCWAPKEKFENNNDIIHKPELEGKEKHVPVIEISDSCGLIPDVCKDAHIKVGSTPHPMQSDHSIQWIDVYLNHQFIFHGQLTPDTLQAAVSVHLKKDQKGVLTAVEFCNVHGYWMAESVF